MGKKFFAKGEIAASPLVLSIGLAIDVKTHCPAAAVQNRGFPTFGVFLQTSRVKPLFSGAKLMLVSGRLLLGEMIKLVHLNCDSMF